MLWSLVMMTALASPDDEEPMVEMDFDFAPAVKMRARFGATPGGAQDIGYFRDRVRAGDVPLPEVFTSEGLFSEHDLPLPDDGCTRLLCTVTAATTANLPMQEDVEWLGQLGFSSGLTAETFTRPPLNLVAVVDQSCSMSGPPIEMVRASLHAMADQLTEQDQLSIVLYGSGVKTHLEPSANRSALHAAIDRIEIDGSTNMEAGMLHGFELARRTRKSFDGTSRVMLFTDERPNVGNTHARGFMDIATKGSHDHIGMTTFGVGVEFGAELATTVSSVRGGNLFFFTDVDDMKKKVTEDFDTMVTELAYDLELVVRPEAGTRIAGLYGIPGDAVKWGDDGSLSIEVKTVFLSKERGGIFVGFAREGAMARPTRRLGTVEMGYTARDGAVEPMKMAFSVGSDAPLGLTRGQLLVDQATSLKRAAMLHHRKNDQEGAYRVVSALRSRLEASGDDDLKSEVELVRRLEQTLAAKAGYTGEIGRYQQDAVSGLPILVTP